MRQMVPVVGGALVVGGILLGFWSRPTDGQTPPPFRPADAVQDAQTPRAVPETRPEQRKTDHDRSAVFSPGTPAPSSSALPAQPDEGKVTGFDFSRDPFGAKKPMQTFEETMKADIDAKPGVMAAQRKLLESRYNLTPRQDPSATDVPRQAASRSGPTAKLGDGMTWDRLAAMKPEDIRSRKLFPYPALPHPKHATGGQVFPQMQMSMFPAAGTVRRGLRPARGILARVSAGDLPAESARTGRRVARRSGLDQQLPPAVQGFLTPVQLDGLRMLLTPLPQEEFNATDDRKTLEPEPWRDLPRLPRQRPHDRAVSPQSRQPPAGTPLPPGHDEPARHVQSADSRLEA